MKNFILVSLLLVAGVARAEIDNVFNSPGFRGASTYEVENKILEMTRAAMPGSSIRAALYGVNRVVVMKELVEASKRGVDVRVVLDGGNIGNINEPGHAINILVNEIQCKEANDCVHFCEGPLEKPLKALGIKKDNGYKLGGSCRGLVINHNKLFLFSQLNDGSHSVVAQTSANMNQGQLMMYQDLMILKNEPELFAEFSKYWSRLLLDKTVLFKKSFPTVHSKKLPVSVYFFPRFTGSDPVLELLKKVNCRLPGSEIRAAQSAFTRAKVAKEMAKLAKEGCSVKIISRIDPAQFSPSGGVRKALGANMVILPFEGKSPEEKNVNSIHTKIVMINASIDNSPEKIPVVMTGSHNLDLFSLRTNDEVLIEVRDQATYDRYSQFLDGILNDALAAGVQLFQ
jgi:phosphatidylserine/phosphatidylglycerophosphate/cardiolipin synthase-like enzyme